MHDEEQLLEKLITLIAKGEMFGNQNFLNFNTLANIMNYK